MMNRTACYGIAAIVAMCVFAWYAASIPDKPLPPQLVGCGNTDAGHYTCVYNDD